MPDLCQAQYLVNNISEGIHRIKCNFGHNDKKIETYGIKYKYRCCLKYKYRYCLLLIHTNFPTNTTIRLFHCCKKVLIFMNIWTMRKKINETSLPKKEDFYSHLNMKGITDADSARKKSL